MRTGRLPYRHDDRTLRLSSYVDVEAQLPDVEPLALSRVATSVPLYMNDRWSTCGPAAAGHAVIGWRHQVAAREHRRPARAPSDRQVTDLYVATTLAQGNAFDPATGANDTGVTLLDMLKVMRTQEIVGETIGAFVLVDEGDRLHDWASRAFGGLVKGYDLPRVVAADQALAWTFTPGRGAQYRGDPDLGHAVFEGDNNGRGFMRDATWGAWRATGRAFQHAYLRETWALVSPEWIADDGRAPSGLDMPALLRDLARVTA